MNAKRNIETRGRTMTTKAIFLLAGKPDKAIKITVKKLKKLGHHIKFCKNIKSLPALDGDDILVVNINNVSEIKTEQMQFILCMTTSRVAIQKESRKHTVTRKKMQKGLMASYSNMHLAQMGWTCLRKNTGNR